MDGVDLINAVNRGPSAVGSGVPPVLANALEFPCPCGVGIRLSGPVLVAPFPCPPGTSASLSSMELGRVPIMLNLVLGPVVVLRRPTRNYGPRPFLRRACIRP